MSRSVFSSSWHQVADLRPRLVAQTRMFRHTYRGQLWYVLQDPVGGRYHRISPSAHALLARMDGQRTVQVLWDEVCASEVDIPTQNEIVDLLVQLHTADLLHCDVTPDSVALLGRYHERRRARWLQRLMNPMSLRFPLWDPDAFLTRVARHLGWVFGPLGALLWLALVAPAGVLAFVHWRELVDNLPDRVLSADNLLLMGLVFVPVKLLHEIGHGLATKRWGGAVREMGLMFLVFAPVPYVDSSASAAFSSKYRRAIVGAAGMMVEVALASCALFAWLLVEPGLTRALAFNVMLIAGVSTLLVNGNPLLRYDGYYILSDLIEIPNLGQRGQQYWRYLIDRYVLGARELEAPAETPGERRWLVPFTVISWAYRVTVTAGIILFIGTKYFVAGTLLAAWGAWNLCGLPVYRAIRHVTTSPTLQRHRGRAIRVALTATVCVLVAVVFIPLPVHTQAEGVVWLTERSQIRAAADGFFVQWLVRPGAFVRAGAVLLIMRDPQVEADYVAAQAAVAEFEARYDAQAFTKPSAAAIIRARLEQARHELAVAAIRRARLTVTAGCDGVLAATEYSDLEGRFLHRGDLIGFVLDRAHFVARVAVEQSDVDLVRTGLTGVHLRAADNPLRAQSSTVLREFPRATDELPTAALTVEGGGQIPTDPREPSGLKALNGVFLFDLTLDPAAVSGVVGSRVYVRFEHEHEPLAAQAYRRLRQLLLSRLNV
jgi:putative peptide zinc metalloprotease protein